MNSLPEVPLKVEVAYLLPARQSFWRWSRDGRCVEWTDGLTIAFRQELHRIFQHLSLNGLPPLDAIVLLLAATRSNWDADVRIDLISKAYATDVVTPGLVDAVIDRRLRVELRSLCDDLQAVASLPVDLREPIASRVSLCSYVFAGVEPETTPALAQSVLRLAESGVDDETLQQCREENSLCLLTTAIESLRPGLARINTDGVQRWLRTGVDVSLHAADVTVPPPRLVRALLRTLRADPELAGVARAASDLLAAIHAPRRLEHADDLPLGGVSDVSNKGNLDRLLVRELAYDDLTLAVRVAAGEAMYLRRESPARHPPTSRWILIDSGIRLWGLPRLFATAVALALASGADEHGRLRVYRANRSQVEPVDLTTRVGIDAHLGQLVAYPDPLPALESAIALAKAEGCCERVEIFLITHELTASSEFFRAISNLNEDSLSVTLATVNAAGGFTLSRVGSLGRREIAKTTLDLSRITGEAPSSPAMQSLTERDPALPVILRTHPFPLCLPAAVQPQHATSFPGVGTVGVTADRRLMLWANQRSGARELTDVIPFGAIHGVFTHFDGTLASVVVGQPKQNKVVLLTVDLKTSEVRTIDCTADRFLAACPLGQQFLLIGEVQVTVVDPRAGPVKRYAIEMGFVWCGSRFFSRGLEIFAAGLDGLLYLARGPAFYFDRPLLGPWRWPGRAKFESADGHDSIQIPDVPELRETWSHGPKHTFVSLDGERVARTRANWSQITLIDLARASVELARNRPAVFRFLLGEAAMERCRADVQLIHKVVAVGRDTNCRLAIRTRSGCYRFQVNHEGQLRLFKSEKNDSSSLAVERKFQRRHDLPGTGFSLYKTTWSEGSCAWLDHRGLLHLVSSDPKLPQITLVLVADSQSHGLGGWLSSGEFFGWKYFRADGATVDDKTVARYLNLFAYRLKE